MTRRTDRRTVAELLARYELEPSLRDIYVEGPSDRTLVELAFVDCGGVQPVRVYEVDTVDVPPQLLEARSLPIGNRGRVLALADELANGSRRDLRSSAVCLADSDLDTILERKPSYPLVVYTSGMSLDALLALPKVLTKLLSVVLLGFPQSGERLLEMMLPILNERLLHRIAAEALEIRECAPGLAKTCKFDGRRLKFERDRFVKRYLEKARMVKRATEFEQLVEAYRPKVGRAPGRHFHIDDFLELLHLCVHSVKPKIVPQLSQFRRFLFGLVETQMLMSLPEIQEITGRFACQDGGAGQAST